MSIATYAIGEVPVAHAVTVPTEKPPSRRQAVARPDATVRPEAR